MCVLDNLECDIGKNGCRASTLVCLIESFNISFISPGSGPASCYGIDISHGPKWSKKGNEYFVKRYRQKTTHARKFVIAINALDESSSEKDASCTVNVTEREMISES